MRYLKENTATRITVGPFIDKTDGFTPEIAITVTSELLTFVVDDAGVPTLVLDVAPTASGGANDMVHITSDAAGFYDLELAAADVNYTGRAILSLNDLAVHLPVWHEFQIVSANVYDSMFTDGDTLDVSVTSMAANVLTATAINADAITAAKIADAAIDNATFAADVGSTAYATNIIALAVRKVLDEIKLDHLVAVAESDDPVDDSIIAKMVDAGSTADWSVFVPTEDSLRAISEKVSGIGSASGGGFNFAPVASNAISVNIDNLGTAVDKSTSPATVGIPVTGHAFLTGHEVTISATVAYNGTFQISSVSANEVVIVSAFTGETFGADDIIKGSIKATTIEGVETTNTFAVTTGQDGVYHVIDDDGGNNFTIAYRFEVGGDRVATEAVFTGFLNGGNDNALIQAYDFVGSAWETRRQFDGQGGSVNQTVVVPLLARNTGTDATDLGNVFLRITDGASSSNPTLNTDALLVEAVGVGRTAGYQNGQIWFDSVNGTDAAEKHVNGASDLPVKTELNVEALIAAGLSPDIHVLNGSTYTLAASAVNYSFFGDNWTLALGSQDVAGAYFQGAIVAGVATSATEVHYEGCEVATMSVQIGHFDFCSFDGTVTMTLAGDYNYHNCYSKVAGPNGPTFAKTAGQTVTAQWRNWSGSINITGLEINDTLTIGGRLGTVDLGSPAAAAVVEIRGTYKELTNVGSAAVNLAGAVLAADVAAILEDTGTTLDTNVSAIKTVTDKFAFTNANEVDANTKSINDAEVVGDGNATPWDGV